MPTLSDGEFYLATDTGGLYVGLAGINFKLGVAMATVQLSGNVNPTQFVEPNVDGSLSVKAAGGATLALDGTDATGVSGYAGGAGIRGWLSSLYAFFNNCAAVKGTLANLLFSVQQPKDCGRVMRVFSATFTPAVVEGMVTLTPITDGVAGGTVSSFTVSAGKRLRLQALMLSITNTTAVIRGTQCTLRMSASGAVTTASPSISAIGAATPAATAQLASAEQIQLPDGIELSGTMQFGISATGTALAGTTVILVGFEY